MHMFTEYYGRQ